VRVLITGASGFVGQHLISQLVEKQPDIELFGTTLRPVDHPSVTFVTVDLRDEVAVLRLLEQSQPEVIVHLAAQASPSKLLESAWNTLQTNI